MSGFREPQSQNGEKKGVTEQNANNSQNAALITENDEFRMLLADFLSP
jgi:hypothetical protein